MKIAVLSDFHLGFAVRSEREKDAFLQARAALEIALREKPDFLLVAGDVFNEELPSNEALHDCFEIFSKIKTIKQAVGVSLVERNGNARQLLLSHIPVFAIHGTHEFCGKDRKNALQVCEAAGFFIYLHATRAIVKKGSETVAVHGLGGVPEKIALSALRQWNPAPEKSAFNVLMLHQSIKEFLPTDDEMNVTISLEDLPQGFDLVVDGHFHWSNEKQLRNSLLLLPGSTVTTQMKSLESTKPKGIFIFDTETKKTSFLEIPNQRRLFYEKLRFENASVDEVKNKVRETLSGFALQALELKPMVRLKLVGTLAKGINASDLPLPALEAEFSEKLILSLDHDFSVVSLKKKFEELRALQKTKASISSMGLELLEKNLEETNFKNAFDVRRIFALLSEGDNEKALELLCAQEEKK